MTVFSLLVAKDINMDPIDIRLGDSENEYLHIRVSQRLFPENTDYWDGNWLIAAAEVSAGAFRGKLQGYLRTEEFIVFSQELTKLYNNLKGTAQFSTMEGWLEINLTGDGVGHIQADCLLNDNPIIGNTLKFSLEIDQTYIPLLLKSIKQVTQTFPIVGRPSS